MDSALEKILGENNLDGKEVFVALTSRGIRDVGSFLARGEEALQDMRDKWGECCKSWDSQEKQDQAMSELKLITPFENNKMRNVLIARLTAERVEFGRLLRKSCVEIRALQTRERELEDEVEKWREVCKTLAAPFTRTPGSVGRVASCPY